MEPGEAYLTREGIHKIKSTLTNQIFKQEMLHTYEQKSQSRDELVREARKAIRKRAEDGATGRAVGNGHGQAGTGTARPARGEPVKVIPFERVG